MAVNPDGRLRIPQVLLTGLRETSTPESVQEVLSRLDRRASLIAAHPDLSRRLRLGPPVLPHDAAALRLDYPGRADPGTFLKGQLGGWGIDYRDPTADRRVLDFCLGVPTDQFLRHGRMRALARRAFADRLPPEVLNLPIRGLQAADWHEGLTADRERLADEIARMEACPSVAAMLDTRRMRRLLEDWPLSGWHSPQIIETYRVALMRALSAGHFLRRAADGPP